jgi:hypothetical protein
VNFIKCDAASLTLMGGWVLRISAPKVGFRIRQGVHEPQSWRKTPAQSSFAAHGRPGAKLAVRLVICWYACLFCGNNNVIATDSGRRRRPSDSHEAR